VSLLLLASLDYYAVLFQSIYFNRLVRPVVEALDYGPGYGEPEAARDVTSFLKKLSLGPFSISAIV
jgi:hypothetical protein